MINTSFDLQSSFMQVLTDAGVEPHNAFTVNTDGNITRFRVKGDKSGSKNGWYVLFNDGLVAGSFGNWKTGFTSSWCSKHANKMSKKEHYKVKLQRQKAVCLREQQRIQEQHDAAVKCGELWNNANPLVKANHPYLLHKQIKAYGIRQLGKNLLIPVQDAQNRLVSIQFIMPDGSKTFKAGGRIKGCFMVIGELKGTVFICEGYATGATIHQATKQGVIVAFNASNLSPVIDALKAEGVDNLKITIAADNDHNSKANTGLIKGKECARKHELPLVYPKFTKQQNGSDFNDLVPLVGFEEVEWYLNDVLKEMEVVL